ncbi:MAG TPA: YkgJ family cysteine cluster protein [Terriglobus sp.]
MLPPGDKHLIQLMDAALADATRRSGPGLACRPGCSQCCHGVFAIGPLDTERLREGFRLAEPAKQQRIRERVQQAVQQLSEDFPGDTTTGILYEDEASQEAFEDFANEAVCPVLDPTTGTCDLYAHRPMTCRVFGPPVQTEEGGFGICELCFIDAPTEVITEAQLYLPDPAIEVELEEQTGVTGTTIIAFALKDL